MKQQIAATQLRLNRLQHKSKQEAKQVETRQKIILRAEVAKAVGCNVFDVDKELILGLLLDISLLSDADVIKYKKKGRKFLFEMTGDLNMGGQDINNAKNITASGKASFGGTGEFGNNFAVRGMSSSNQPPGYLGGVIAPDYYAGAGIYIAKKGTNISDTAWAFRANRDGYLEVTGNINAGGTITAAGQVIARNGYGDTMWFGGDAAGNDYEIRLQSPKALSIFSPNAADYTTVLNIYRNAKIKQRLATNGLDPNDLPAGWSGGLRTNDIYAAGTVGAGSGGAVNAYMNSSGNIYASNDVNVGHQVNTQYVWASGNLNSNYIHSNGNIDADGRVNAGEFVYINGQASVGAGCSPNGLQGRTSSGDLLSCVNGLWKSLKGRVESTSWMISGDHPNYGNLCESSLVSTGRSAEGWVVTGSDVCTEDAEYCTIDNLKCYAVRIID